MTHICPLCNKPLTKKHLIVFISNPIKPWSTNGSSISCGYFESKEDEQVVHFECLKGVCPKLGKLFNTEIEDRDDEQGSSDEVYETTPMSPADKPKPAKSARPTQPAKMAVEPPKEVEEADTPRRVSFVEFQEVIRDMGEKPKVGILRKFYYQNSDCHDLSELVGKFLKNRNNL